MDPWEHDDEGATAIDEACARLGRPRRWIAEDGREHTIVGGAVGGGKVAWVERRCADDGSGWVDVAYHLRVASDGAPLRAWCVETYNPYFGCEVLHLAIGADELVMVYAEKHATIVAVLPWVGPVRLREIGRRWRAAGDRVLWQSEAARGLVEWVTTPGLVEGLPLPLAEVDAALARAGSSVWAEAGSVPDAAAVQAAVVRRLFGERSPEPLAELLVGALAWRYWDDRRAVIGASYEALPRGADEYNDPCWLPWYWQQAQAGAEGEATLAVLVALAGREAAAPEAGADGWRVELASRHVAGRCGALAAACRAGRLPAGESCHFWAPWSQAGFAAAPRGRFPDGLWRAWRSLRQGRAAG